MSFDVGYEPRCSYFGLLASVEFYATGVSASDAGHCDAAPTCRVSLRSKHRSHDMGVELCRNLCAEHEQQVRRMPGWSWSRSKTVTA